MMLPMCCVALWCWLVEVLCVCACVYAAGENNVFLGMDSFAGTWRSPVWKPLYGHVLISSGEMVFPPVYLIKSFHGWLGRPLCASFGSETQEFCPSWLYQGFLKLRTLMMKTMRGKVILFKFWIVGEHYFFWSKAHADA